jgi:hypothetical protein
MVSYPDTIAAVEIARVKGRPIQHNRPPAKKIIIERKLRPKTENQCLWTILQLVFVAVQKFISLSIINGRVNWKFANT